MKRVMCVVMCMMMGSGSMAMASEYFQGQGDYIRWRAPLSLNDLTQMGPVESGTVVIKGEAAKALYDDLSVAEEVLPNTVVLKKGAQYSCERLPRVDEDKYNCLIQLSNPITGQIN